MTDITPHTLSVGLFPEGIHAVLKEIDVLQADLLPEELGYVQRAVTKRRREFIAGRTAAREALRALGHPHVPAIQAGTNREPVWPAGYTGSIAHDSCWCCCAVARCEQYRSIGVDIEQIGRVKTDFWKQLFTPHEIDWLNQHHSDQQPMLSTLLFSAKEAFYKLQYPLTETWLEFKDVRVEPGMDKTEVHVYFKSSCVQSILGADTVHGRYARLCDMILTAFWLPAIHPELA